MTKRFRFDDEDDINEDYQQPSRIDEFESMREEPITETKFETEEDVNDLDEEEVTMPKKKKFVWKWWHYVLIVFVVLILLFVGYIYLTTKNDGPVYGKRCEGLEYSISNDIQDATTDTMKTKYSEIQSIHFEIACKQLKVDIVYKDKMDTKKAKAIAEEAVQTLDKMAGVTKEDDKTYSQLFGYANNEPQFEVNLILFSENSDDFPIYGTKHVQNDSFSYTYASIKDKDSYQKARDTLEEDEDK